MDLSLLPMLDPDAMEAEMARIDAARRETERAYEAMVVRPEEIGSRQGPVHAASILVWTRIAELAGVPHIPCETVAVLGRDAIEKIYDERGELTPEERVQVDAAEAYCSTGGFWRTELCAGSTVKGELSNGRPVPDVLPFDLYDMRIIDMHYGMPDFKIIARPRLTPVMHAGFPVEFRVFFGGRADDGAASWYYPQAGIFDVTPELEAAMAQAIAWGRLLHGKRAEMGLTPTLVSPAAIGDEIGSTIDFMLTQERGLVMVDAGPGFGYGAHPCCFIDMPVEGVRWHLAEGVSPR